MRIWVQTVMQTDCCVGGAQLEAVLEEMPKWGLVQEVLQVFA